MVMVAEALSDENKSSRGGQKGDQTGKEIVVREFIVKRNYKWDCVLRCKNKQMAETAAGYAKRIAECSKFGYNQSDRWSGPKAIEKVGVDNLEYAQKGDFDCSSLVLECYRLAGLPIKMTGYTGSMRKILLNTGMFEEFTDAEHIDSSHKACTGDIYLASGHHTLIVLNDGDEADKHEDDLNSYVQMIKGRLWMRYTPNGKKYCTVGVDSGPYGDGRIPYRGFKEPDFDFKWWWAVTLNGVDGFISSAVPQYAILVEE